MTEYSTQRKLQHFTQTHNATLILKGLTLTKWNTSNYSLSDVYDYYFNGQYIQGLRNLCIHSKWWKECTEWKYNVSNLRD